MSPAGSAELAACAIKPINICDKSPVEAYVPSVTYTRLTGAATSVTVGGDGSDEVRVLARAYPVNASASAAPWVNDTVHLNVSCPAALPFAGGNRSVSVLGRHFTTTERMYCRWVVADDPVRLLYARAAVVSDRHLVCDAPEVSNPSAAASLVANLSVAYVGGDFDTTFPLGFTFAASPAAVATAAAAARWGSLQLNGLPADLCDVGAWEAAEPPYEDTRTQTWFDVRGLERLLLSFDLAHMPPEVPQEMGYRIALYVERSVCADATCDADHVVVTDEAALQHVPCRQPLLLPAWFTDAATPKAGHLNFSVLALEDLRVRVELQTLYGVYLPAAAMLLNTTAVDRRGPTRARPTAGDRAPHTRLQDSPLTAQQRRTVDAEAFLATYALEYQSSLMAPLNLPPRFAGLERGRALVAFNVSPDAVAAGATPWLTRSEADTLPPPTYWDAPQGDLSDAVATYRETFHEITGLGTEYPAYAFTRMILPYLPYFSSCLGYGAYVPLYDLVEDAAGCELPEYAAASPGRAAFPPLPDADDVRLVGPLDIGASPVADACARAVPCRYEETIAAVDPLPRWMEAGDGTELFTMPARALTYGEYLQGAATLDAITEAEGRDAVLSVSVDRSAAEAEVVGGCAVQCFPRTVTLELRYYAESLQVKTLVDATLVFSDHDTDVTNTNYSLGVEFYPLNYVDLVIAFAFPRLFFIAMFVIIGILVVAATIVFWALNRCVSRRKNVPSLHVLPFFRLLLPPAMVGVGMVTLPVAVVVAGVRVLLNGSSAVGVAPSSSSESGVWLMDALVSSYSRWWRWTTRRLRWRAAAAPAPRS